MMKEEICNLCGTMTNIICNKCGQRVCISCDCNCVDMVKKPSHYAKFKYEPIDCVMDWDLNFNLGNVVKYVVRCNHKGNKKQDLEKAIEYLKHELANGN